MSMSMYEMCHENVCRNVAVGKEIIRLYEGSTITAAQNVMGAAIIIATCVAKGRSPVGF